MTDHSGDATNMQNHMPDATKIVTREEREELRRLWEGENRAAMATGDSEEWEIVARVLARKMFLALPRLLATIDALEAENARLRREAQKERDWRAPLDAAAQWKRSRPLPLSVEKAQEPSLTIEYLAQQTAAPKGGE